MDLNPIIKRVTKHGDIEVIKAGAVFTLLMTGKGLSKLQTVIDIQRAVTEATREQYPILEAMKNSETFLLMVLKPRG